MKSSIVNRVVWDEALDEDEDELELELADAEAAGIGFCETAADVIVWFSFAVVSDADDFVSASILSRLLAFCPLDCSVLAVAASSWGRL